MQSAVSNQRTQRHNRKVKVNMANVRIKKTESQPESTEILAEAIVKIGAGFEALQASGLNRRAITVLLCDATKLPKRDIETVIDALAKLRGWYCRAPRGTTP